MDAIARDADERYQRKQENIKKAKILKEKGNQEMKKKNFEKAENYYTQGLDLVRDFKGNHYNYNSTITFFF